MAKKVEYTQMSLFPEMEATETTKVSAKSVAPVVTESVADDTVYDHTQLFERLAQSDFRMSFHLKPKDLAYIREKGLETIRQHAADFVAKRLAPADIPNDGKQTPMHGHPVFLAQHATACCCRGCFQKWHHIPAGRSLSPVEQRYAVSVLMEWIKRELKRKESV